MMMTYLCCEPGQTSANLQRILNVYRQAEEEGVTKLELEQAKSKFRSRIVLSAERPRGRLFAVGSDWLYRREYCPVEKDLQEIADVSVEQVTAVLDKYPLTRPTTVTIGPLVEVSQPK